ncbi:uncharacterized protein EI90DRAFT_3091077 [Cantharellus anzutake]|uniref:uncharacterized protein n=1 Tax=Cantharellus anzutake TaxID=1750568 RepID=UPI0019071050|nr:uncharacterized protein EI90DRAFT_3091077 [Cantharellus anzutake]KAF8313960.1 hypothetical protein EI90DRAFT_3091077 [Cantharellus anzutake]
MDISSIISPHQSTGQQQPHPINTQSTTVTVSLPSPPQTSLASTSAPHRPAQMPQSPSRKRSLSPTFGSEAMRPTDQDDPSAGRPRKFWKSATGHRRGITISEMIPITAPTNYRRPPASISRPHTSVSPSAVRRGRPTARGVGTEAPSSPATGQSSLSPIRDTQSPPSPERGREELEEEEYSREGSADSDAYLITTEDGRVVSIADSPAARKRRQNTIAARRSRQRKLEYVRMLERKVEDLEKERDDLKARCEKAEEKVQWLREMIVEGRGGGGSRGEHGLG